MKEADFHRGDFLGWARESAVPLVGGTRADFWADLEPFGRMIGDARVVALGEGEHLIAEPLEFRNRVLQYLVESKGFTAIAIESGIVESRAVHEYVRGGPGDLATVLAEGISWTFHELSANQALIRWLREYNEEPRRIRKVNFYGFDVPGSPGNPKALRGVETALVTVLAFLRRMDPGGASAFHARIDALLPDMRLNPYGLAADDGYQQLTQAERDTITATIADVIAMLQRCEARFIAASSADDYHWACRAAVGAWQVDQWLRQVAAGPTGAQGSGLLELASDLRDRAQADNLEWILGREGPSGKLLMYGHNYHLSAAPITRSWRSLESVPRVSGTYRREVAGAYLRRRLGNEFVAIGNAIGQGTLGRTGSQRTLARTPPESIDGFASEIGIPQFLLDLRAVPDELAGWLGVQRQLGRTYEAYRKYQIHSATEARQAFDILYFVDTVTPASEGAG